VADIVINLESPWNPAVLEQRIARVHRLGQHRPVQVYHLVTRDSIEDRVQRVVSRKRELFEALFQGTSDEVSFESVGQQTFLETVRELFHEETPTATPETACPAPTPTAQPSALFVAGVQFLEALAESLPADPQAGRIEPEVLARGVAALRKLLAKLDPEGGKT
jgi:hypothetical protein